MWECAPDLSIASDPAGSIGYAALNGLTWFARKWPGGCESLSIAVKELIPIVFFFFLAVHIWGHEWSRKRILFMCDVTIKLLLLV